MTDQFENHSPDESEPPRPSRWLVIGLLFVLTLGGTYAARLAADTNAIDTKHGSDLERLAVRDAITFKGRLDRGAVHVGGDGLVHLELIAKGAELPERAASRRPTDVVVVLDRSGSMAGDPMAKALAAIRELVGQLGSDDRFALVTYAHGANVAIPLDFARFSSI